MSKLWIFYTVMALVWATMGFIKLCAVKDEEWGEDSKYVHANYPRMATCVEIIVVVLWSLTWPLSLALTVLEVLKKESK
jgi:hypothetical protein